jgi:hypothetical protein
MPFYKDENGALLFMADRYWKHMLQMHPGVKEVVPEPIIETDETVDTSKLKYTQFNALEKKPEIKRNVSTAAKRKRTATRKVR